MNFLLILSLILGLIVGSFLNVVICRLPRQESIRGRSRCPHCHRTLEWFELIPVLSFFLLKRKCRTCKQVISWQYPLVELATAALFTISAFVRFQGADAPTLSLTLWVLRDWVIVSALLVTFVTDLTSQLIYDAPLFTTGLLTLALTLLSGMPLLPALAGGILGSSFFGLQYVISKGKWIGAGDIILGGFLGIGLGFPLILVALALAYVSGLLAALPLLFLKIKRWTSRIAFGTFLSAAGVITLFWGDAILAWYLRLVMF